MEKSETYAFDFFRKLDYLTFMNFGCFKLTENVMLSYKMTNLSYNTDL